MSETPVRTFALMSLRAYAKRRGVSPMAISDAVKHGRLSASVGRDENGVPKIRDPDLADREWLQNGDYSRHPERIPPTPAGVPPVAVEAEEADPASPVSMHEAGTREKHWRAKLAELKYKEAVKELVQASEIRDEWTGILSAVRSKLLGVPSQARSALPSLTTDDVLILENLIREALSDLVEAEGPAGE